MSDDEKLGRLFGKEQRIMSLPPHQAWLGLLNAGFFTKYEYGLAERLVTLLTFAWQRFL